MNRLRILSLLSISSVVIFSLFVSSAFADTSYLNNTITSLEPLSKNSKSFSVFYPVFLMVSLAFMMAIALIRRNDKVSAVFGIAATLISIVLSLMFLSPYDFTYPVTDTRITAEQSQLTGMIANNTSINIDTQEANVIPHDNQFRFLISSFFSVFTLLNGMLTILIFTKWSKETL